MRPPGEQIVCDDASNGRGSHDLLLAGPICVYAYDCEHDARRQNDSPYLI